MCFKLIQRTDHIDILAVFSRYEQQTVIMRYFVLYRILLSNTVKSAVICTVYSKPINYTVVFQFNIYVM